MKPEIVTAEKPRRIESARRWLKRIGVGGFLFFLVKGLLWLTVPLLLAWLRSS